MPQIVYRGPHSMVSVPAYQLADVEHGVPIEVSAEVAEALTLGGASTAWLPVAPAPTGKGA